MRLTFLAPAGALAALAVALPLAAALLRARRERRLRAALRLAAPGPAARLPSLLALATVLLLAVAAAQPALEVTTTRTVRTDAEVIFLLDTSRSMLAAPAPADRTRFARAADLALAVRADLAGFRAGVASLTDRALPHLFPTADRAAFAGVVRRSLAPDRPPPRSASGDRATDLLAVRSLAVSSYFSPDATRRLLVVLTDGESRPFPAGAVGAELRDEEVALLLVHVWGEGERVFGLDGRPERYRPDEQSRRELARLARESGRRLLAEGEPRAIAAAAREALGQGPEAVAGTDTRHVLLAPAAVVAAGLALALLLAVARGPRGAYRGGTSRQSSIATRMRPRPSSRSTVQASSRTT